MYAGHKYCTDKIYITLTYIFNSPSPSVMVTVALSSKLSLPLHSYCMLMCIFGERYSEGNDI